MQPSQGSGLCKHVRGRDELEIHARTQRRFYVAFEFLVLTLTAAAAAVLIFSLWRLVSDDFATPVQAIAHAAAVLVTGGASAFLQRQASDAKKRYEAALRTLEKRGSGSVVDTQRTTRSKGVLM